jgi:hypothetical protein
VVIEPGDQVPRHFVAIDLVQALVAPIGIGFVRHFFEPGRAVRFEQLIDVAANRVTATAEDVDGKLFRDAGLADGPGDVL